MMIIDNWDVEAVSEMFTRVDLLSVLRLQIVETVRGMSTKVDGVFYE